MFSPLLTTHTWEREKEARYIHQQYIRTVALGLVEDRVRRPTHLFELNFVKMDEWEGIFGVVWGHILVFF